MTTVFYAGPYGRFTEIKTNLKIKKLYGVHQDCNLIGGSSSDSNNVGPLIQYRREEKDNFSIFKDDFFQE